MKDSKAQMDEDKLKELAESVGLSLEDFIEAYVVERVILAASSALGEGGSDSSEADDGDDHEAQPRTKCLLISRLV